MQALCIKTDEQYGFEQGKEYTYEEKENGYRITVSLEKYWFTTISKYDFSTYFKVINSAE